MPTGYPRVWHWPLIVTDAIAPIVHRDSINSIHRNSFINSPRLLDEELRLNSRPNIRFAGQITGCEGYVESAVIGLIAARFAAAELQGREMEPPPREALLVRC